VILDQCTYHPLQKKGTLTLVLQSNPLFQLKIKEGQLKVLDYIFYQEGVSMTPENPSSDLDDSYQEEEISTENAPMQPLSIADEIPLSLRVEVGALNMSLKELVQIKPGSVIPLSTHPEREVKLTLNGKTVALGELIEMDETVGIKILQLP
jgi:type III secretion system YscQ/HrcQ family protein